MLDRDKLAERLRMERARKKVTQAEVGAAIGSNAAVVCGYENGTHVPTLEKLAAISRYYGVTTDYLLGK
jgi:transcriptional regulator with XRE-family HTH domain